MAKIKLHVTSASALETFKTCKRKWYFQKIMKLPEPARAHFAQGTILHACLERYLEADKNGYDKKTGEPVDKFPEDWFIAFDRYGNESGRLDTDYKLNLVQTLVEAAIDEGVVIRHEGGLVEEEIGKGCEIVPGVGLKGYIDYWFPPNNIEDHKTTSKNQYAKTPKTLHENLQVRLYAWWKFREYPELDEINVSHNIFVTPKETDKKEKPRVKKVTTTLQRDDVENWWKEVIVPMALAIREIVDNAKSFEDVEKTEDTNACYSLYGGCPFLRVCSGEKSAQEFATGNLIEDKLLDLFKRKAEQKMSIQLPNAIGKPPEDGVTPNTEEPKRIFIPDNGGNWPTYQDGCETCSGNKVPGWVDNKTPCPSCVAKAAEMGINHDHFEFKGKEEVDGVKSIKWGIKDRFKDFYEGMTEGRIILSGQEEKIKVERVEEKIEVADPKTFEAEVKTESEPKPEPKKKKAASVKKSTSKKLTTKTIVLAINVPTRTNTVVVRETDIWNQFSEAMGDRMEDLIHNNYPWNMKPALSQWCQENAESWAGHVVEITTTSGNQEYPAMIEGIRKSGLVSCEFGMAI